jgi:hypothetical protein
MTAPHTFAVAALLLALGTAQAQTVSVAPLHTDVTIGASFSVELEASGFPDKIFGGGYDLAFDPTILKLDDISFPASWEFLTFKGAINNVAGTATDVFFNTFSAPVKGDFLTATLKFTAIGLGTSAISVNASPSFPFANEASNAVDVSYVGGSVTAVPEPGALAMLLAGIGCLGWVARRRQG